jgi:dTMP kinase
MTARRGPHGRLVAIEGIDGSGKSTLVRALARALRRRGVSVATRREPTDRTLGALAARAAASDPWTGAVYFTLDRLAARPALARELGRNDLVLTDRSLYSTLAYQGSALPARARAQLVRLQATATIRPDRVVLLDLSPAQARRRRSRRSSGREPLEREAVQRRVAAEYRRLAERGRWIVVDASRPVASLAAELAARLATRRAGARAAPSGRSRRRR